MAQSAFNHSGIIVGGYFVNLYIIFYRLLV